MPDDAWGDVDSSARGPLQRVTLGVAGTLLVILAGIGAFVPGLPSTPFVLLAGWCFARSIPAGNQFLQRSWLFGPMIRRWQQERAITQRTRITACLMTAAAVLLSVYSVSGRPGLMLLIAAAGLAGIATVLRLPVVDISQSDRGNH